MKTNALLHAAYILGAFSTQSASGSESSLNRAMTRAIEMDCPGATCLLASFVDMKQSVFFKENRRI